MRARRQGRHAARGRARQRTRGRERQSTPGTSSPTSGPIGLPGVRSPSTAPAGHRRRCTAPAPRRPCRRAHGRWTTVLDYDVTQVPASYPANYRGLDGTERPWEQTLLTNLSLVQDPTQPGTGSAGAARLLFRPTPPGGTRPSTCGGEVPGRANNGSLASTFTMKLSANWDNNGAQSTNGGPRRVLRDPAQNNHFIADWESPIRRCRGRRDRHAGRARGSRWGCRTRP